MRPLPLLALACAPFVAGTARAIDTTAWRHVQTVRGEPGALCSLELPDATLDGARPDLGDLRLTDATGRDIPYVLDRATAATALTADRLLAAKTFTAELQADKTVLLLTTGQTDPIDRVDLDCAGVHFLKPVRVEASQDGVLWTTLAQGRPVFRNKNGAAHLAVDFPATACAFLRLTVDDATTPPVPFTGARIHVVRTTIREARDPRSPVPATILAREERAGVTRLRVDLGAANLPLAAITPVTDDPMHMRRVRVVTDDATELGAGHIWAVSGAGITPQSHPEVALATTAPGREVTVLIENGDNPPLPVSAVRVDRRPVRLIFLAPAGGDARLYSGNPHAATPSYDIFALRDKLDQSSITRAQAGDRVANPDHRPTPPKPLPQVAAAPLDAGDWVFRKPVIVASAGVQRLEPDWETLCRARGDLGDLRLLQGDRQIPYLRATQDAPERAHPVGATTATAKPGFTRLLLDTPAGAPPLTAVSLDTDAPVFRRKVRLLRRETTTRDGPVERLVAETEWVRTGDDTPRRPMRLTLSGEPLPGPLLLELVDGENAPIATRDHTLHTRAPELIFIVQDTTAPVTLAYGNASATPPAYDDLRLVAPRLLTEPASRATLGPAQETAGAHPLKRHAGTVLFVTLTAVVIALLALLFKMMPKSDDKSA